jgi:hypothetical protein
MTGSRHREGSYTREHLEGADFAGADLSDADFSDADFRGTDFTGARLRGATFRRSSFGVSRRWLLAFMSSCLVIGGVAGAGVSLAGQAMWEGANSDDSGQLAFTILTLSIFVLFVGITLFRGLGTAIHLVFAIVIATTLVITGGALALGVFDGQVFLMDLMVTLLVVSFVAGAAARIAAGAFGLITFVITSFAAALLAGLNGGSLFVVFSLLLTTFIARRALSGDARDGWIRRLSVEIVGARGTRFANADLTNADLRNAYLGIVDFRGASLSGAMFDGATITSGALFDLSSHPNRDGKGTHPDSGPQQGERHHCCDERGS